MRWCRLPAGPRPWRLGETLLILFGGIALAMGGVGVYAAFAQVVASRRREFAIRSALGADRARLARMVFANVFPVAASGIVVGASIALAGGQYIASLLFRTVPYDPAVLCAAAALVLALAAIGAAVPARSASRAEPGALLRM